MIAAHHKLSNLTVIVDRNDVQLDGPVHEIMGVEPFIEKWQSFNFKALEINGHDMGEVLDALDTSCEIHSEPMVIIAHTTKGKGVSFMENECYWHGVAPNDEELAKALSELRGEQV